MGTALNARHVHPPTAGLCRRVVLVFDARRRAGPHRRGTGRWRSSASQDVDLTIATFAGRTRPVRPCWSSKGPPTFGKGR